MKKLLLSFLVFVSFLNLTKAQCDIATNGVSLSAGAIDIGQTAVFTFDVYNHGTDPLCTYPANTVSIVFTLPSGGEYIFDSFVSPLASGDPNIAIGSRFTFTYNPGTKKVTATNHLPIAYNEGDFDVKFRVKAIFGNAVALESKLEFTVAPGQSNGSTLNDLATISLKVNNLFITYLVTQIPCDGTVGTISFNHPTATGYPYRIKGPGFPTPNGLVINSNTIIPVLTLGPGSYTYTIQDTFGNTITKIIVIDPIKNSPNASVNPTNFQLDCNTPTKELTASGGGTYLWSANAGSVTTPNVTVSAAGTYTVTVTGSNGCTAIASSIITFLPDTEKPVIKNCPTFLDLQGQPTSNLFISTGPNSTTCNEIAEWTPPTATDNCKVKSLNFTTSPTAGLLNGGLFPVGTTLVTYTATDDAGNTSTCTFNVVVGDNTAPVLSGCPVEAIAAMTTLNDTECSTLVEIPQITITDNCAKILKFAWDITGATTLADFAELTSDNGTFTVNFTFLFKVGTSHVVITFEDENGNSNICEFDVVVTDATPPVITKCPTKQTIEGCSIAALTIPYSEADQLVLAMIFNQAGGTATDNCEIKTISYKDTQMGSCPIVITRVWTVTDAASLSTSCTQIIEIDDNTPPALKPNTMFPIGETETSACVAPAGPAEAEIKALYEDNCGGIISVKKSIKEEISGCTWDITYEYEIKDACENIVLPKPTIRYQGFDDIAPSVVIPVNFFDTNPPVIIDANGNVNFNTPSTECKLNVVFGKPIVSDNCTNANSLIITISAKDKDGNPVLVMNQATSYSGDFPLGKNTLTITVTDNCNNTTTKVITVTIIDNVKPDKPTLPNITGCGAIAAPTTKDNCSTLITGTTSDPTEYYIDGIYTINWLFTDDSGNTEIATQQVTVTGSGIITGSVVRDNTPLNNLVDGLLQSSLSAYVSLVKGTTIVATVPLASGIFTLPDVCPGTYNVVLHTTSTGSISPQLPVGYGGFAGEGPLNGSRDASPNGVAVVTISSGSIVYGNAKIAAGGDVSFALAPLALPVRLISFTGKSTENGNELTWKVSSEQNFSHYEIERSANAKEFKMIGKVSGARNTTENLSYTYLDDFTSNLGVGMLPGANSSLITYNSSLKYYRLKMVDLDGSFDYSKVIFIENVPIKSSVGSFYPNPAFDKETTIDITSNGITNWVITSYDLLGKINSKSVHTLNTGINKLKINIGEIKDRVSIFKFESEEGIQYRRLVK